MSYVMDNDGNIKAKIVQTTDEQAAMHNMLLDPGFEQWTYGPGPFTFSTDTGYYFDDRWYGYEYSIDDFQVQRDATTKRPDSAYSCKVTFTLNGPGGSFIEQRVYCADSADKSHNYYHIRGKEIVASFWIKYTTAQTSAAKAYLDSDGTGSEYSEIWFASTTDWQLITMGPITIPQDATYVRLQIAFWKTDVFYVDNCMMVATNDTTAAYQGLEPRENRLNLVLADKDGDGDMTPLTSTSWDGDAKSGSGTINWNSVFGVPARAKAVLIHCIIMDSAADNQYFAMKANSAGAAWSMYFYEAKATKYYTGHFTVPIAYDGTSYYTAAGTIDYVYISVVGWYI